MLAVSNAARHLSLAVSPVAEPSPLHKMQHALQEKCCPVQATNDAMGNLSLAISTVAEPIPVDVIIVQLNGVQQQAQQLGYSRRGLRQGDSLQLTINVIFPPVSYQVKHNMHPGLCTWLSQGYKGCPAQSPYTSAAESSDVRFAFALRTPTIRQGAQQLVHTALDSASDRRCGGGCLCVPSP